MSVTWLDGVTLAVQFGYGYRPFEVPAAWTDEAAYVRQMTLQSSQRTSEIADFSPGSASIVLDNRDRRFDAAYGPAKVTFDGTASNYFSAGDLAAFAGATALDVRAAISLDDWTPGTGSAIVSQFGAAGQRSWSVDVTTGGYLQLVTSSDGTATTVTDSGCRIAAVDGQLVCVRVTWQSSDGATKYYVKRTTPARARADCLAHTGWTQLGATDTNGTGALFNSTSAVRVADRVAGGVSFFGSVYYADARTTIGSDTLRFAFWPQDAADSTDTSWTASAGAGETWTGTGSAYSLVDAGGLYGSLLPGVPVRVYATYDAVDYPLWAGYVRRWTAGYAPGGVDATVTVQAVDALGWLATMPAPDSPYGIELASIFGRSYSYWSMREPFPAQTLDDWSGAAPAAWRGFPAASVPGQPVASAGRELLATNGARAESATAVTAVPWASYPALMFWVYVPDETAIFRVIATNGDVAVCFNYGIGGDYFFQGGVVASQQYGYFPGRLTPGHHHIAVVDYGEVPGAVTLFVDGAGIAAGLTSGELSDLYAVTGLLVDGAYGAVVTDISLTPGAAAVTAIADLYAAGMTGRALESSAARVGWLLDGAGVTEPNVREISATVSSFLGPTSAGVTWASLLKQVDAAEAGLLYVAGGGGITFLTRVDLGTGARFTTPQATFGEESGEVAYSDIVVDAASIDDVVNQATVSIATGAAGSYRDETSIALYGQSSVSTSAPLASTGEAANLARHLVGLRAHPGVRVRRLELTPRSDPATMYPQALGRLIGDRITVRRRPTDTLIPSTPTPEIDVDVRIEGIRHSVTPDNWVTSFVTAPAPLTAQEAGLFTADDAILGVVDSGVVVAY